MTRPARFSREELVSSALALAAGGGPEAVTMQGLAAAVGAPSGSVYHRFSGRPELLAEVWLAAVDRFQLDWWAAAQQCDDPGALAALTVRWAREHREVARVLSLHRAEDFLGAGVPDSLRRRVRAQRARAAAALAVLARRLLDDDSARSLERVTFALATLPVAALRGPLGTGQPIGDTVEVLVREAATALLARR